METHPETRDTNAETFHGDDEGEAQYWEGLENEDDQEAESGDQESDQDMWGLSQGQGSQHVWLSDEERLRIAFKRARTSAEKVDLDRSPFFPRTVAEYAGLKAGMLEARAARLRAKVREREMALRARDGGGWKRVFVVGGSGRTEEKVIPVYYGRSEESKPAAPSAVKGSSTGADVASAVQGEAAS